MKGILDERDALIAKKYDIDGIIVSNHGGRQLDGTLSSILALKKITEKLDKSLDIYFDGGIRTGQDIIKALALGAKGIFMGRPYLYGLGAGGAKGIERVIEILVEELTTALVLCGETDVNNLNSRNLY